tara:strand:- start:262 stop:531 length:270 start_codon:yes stop_codon:yes gene_type:complete
MEYISYLATPLLVISSFPQLLKMYKSKSSQGVSVTMFYLTLASVLLLFLEAKRLNSYIIMIADIASMIMLILNIYLIHKYRLNKSQKVL